MNRLTDNDKNYGPFTIARWRKTISAYIESGDDENAETKIIFVAFGWAIRIRVWNWLCKPWREKWIECNWDAETVKRLGRSGYWSIHSRRFGFSLSNMGNGYDFLQIFFGPQTHSSDTTKSWGKHLPWKQWDCVRSSIYSPDGKHFATEERGKWHEFYEMEKVCPKVHFGFEDYDGEMIVATCHIEEREWHKGSGWFKWLRFFSRPKIRRTLDLEFSEEVGPQKGSWKGGTIGHSIEMLQGESPKAAFMRYCQMEHERKGRKFRLRFVGPCNPPPPKPVQEMEVASNTKCAIK